MASNILVPIDESERSKEALEFALQEYPNANITALHVIDPSEFHVGSGIEGSLIRDYDQVRENYENRAANLLEDARDTASAQGIEIETDRVDGRVTRSIVEYASEHGMDQIIIGSHGRTGASRILLGSVAENVVRRSPVPVTVVR
ncbi:MAG: universal stress protein [Halobacteriota archaeon]